MTAFFDIKGEDLGRLGSVEAAELFRDLLFAEASIVGGVDRSKIDVPCTRAAVTTPDGGIDAEVSEAAPANSNRGVIKQGKTCYQIKTGNVDITNPSSAKNAISIHGRLNPRVKSCLEANGTLVMVLFGSDKPDNEDEKSARLLRGAIAELDPRFQNYEKVEVWRQSKLVGFLRDFPAIRMSLNPRMPAMFHTLDTWSRFEGMRHAIVGGEQLNSLIAGIRNAVHTKSVPIRVLGDPGVGKTRAVLEAVSYGELAPLVLYVEKPSALIESGYLRMLMLADDTEHCILVVDECERIYHDQIWNYIGSVSDRVQLITIYNASEAISPRCAQFEVQALESADVAEVLSAYNVPERKAYELAGLCSGSPRVAHMIGEQILATGHIDIKSEAHVWESCIAGYDGIGGEAYRKRLWVLEWLALFKRFGYGRPYEDEGSLVVEKIVRSTGLSRHEVRSIIGELQRRRLLQGDATLYITPKMLHLWLWARWWEEQGQGFRWDKFIKVDENRQLTDDLVKWFVEMLEYGRESASIPSIAEELLGPDGPFRESVFLGTSAGISLAITLAELSPSAMLNYIEHYLLEMEGRERGIASDKRRAIIGALEIVARKPPLFRRSAIALSKLALAENEPYANNATGTFAELFSNGIGPISPTEASPSQRFPVLEEFAKSAASCKRSLAIKAFSKALETMQGRSYAVRESDALREDPDGWWPETYEEIKSAYRNVWQLAVVCLGVYDEEQRHELARVLASAQLGLLHFFSDDPEIVDWIKDYAASGFADAKALVSNINRILKNPERLTEEARDGLQEILRMVEGEGYENEMRRYVGMRFFEEEPFSRDGKPTKADTVIVKLARYSMANLGEFKIMLPWLVSKLPENGYRFGKELGQCGRCHSLWLDIVDALRKLPAEERGTQFCEGYLKAVFLEDVGEWEFLLDGLAEDSELAPLVPSITCGSGMTDNGLLRMLKLLDDGTIEMGSLSPLVFGNIMSAISDDAIELLLQRLLNVGGSSGARLAIAIIHMQMREGRAISPVLMEESLCHDGLFDGGAGNSLTMLSYEWSEVTLGYLSERPERAGALADKIMSLVATPMGPGHSYYLKVLHKLAELAPRETLNAIANILTGEEPYRVFRITGWFEDKDVGVLGALPREVIFDWIEGDSETRAPLVARNISSHLYDDEGETLIARDILVRYGRIEEVRRQLHMRRSCFSWTGDETVALDAKIQRLRSWKELDGHPNVQLWIDEAIADFEQERERAVLRIEREGW